MDLWSQLVGRKNPTLVVVEPSTWIDLPPSAAIDHAMERRARKERWTDAAEGHEFHVLLVLRASFPGTHHRIEVHSAGSILAQLDQVHAASVIPQMLADQVSATAAKAEAIRGTDGAWSLRLGL